MYWRGGSAHVLLWIASLTLAMSAAAALLLTGSRGAGLFFMAAAVVLAPPIQDLIAEARHRLAPAKAALYSSILFIPAGLGFLVVDGVAMLDREAARLGFSSAGHWARAKDLNLPTPQALAVHDEVQRKAQIESFCRDRQERPPLSCYDTAHQKSALAFVEARLGGGELEGVVRDAMAQQRKTLMAADGRCSDLLDRIDEDAVPMIIENRSALVAVAAGAWARQFSKLDFDQLLARSKPGASYISSGGDRALGQRLDSQAPAIDKEIDVILQAWARQIVVSEPSWRSFLKGRTPLQPCALLQQASRN